MPEVTIHFNPKCSKSQQILELIRSRCVELKIVLYLKLIFLIIETNDVLDKTQVFLREIMRICESFFTENRLSNNELSERKLKLFLIKFPKLIERPIAIIET